MTYFSGLNKKITKKEQKPKMPKPKILAYVLTVVATIGYFSLFTNFVGFMKYFLLGTFGVVAYVLFACMYLMSGMILKGKKYNITPKYGVVVGVALVCVLSLFHMALSGGANLSNYGSYLSSIYHMQNSIGGVVLGLIIFPIQKLLGAGAYFLFVIGLIICVAIIYNMLSDAKVMSKIDFKLFKKKEKKSVEPANNLQLSQKQSEQSKQVEYTNYSQPVNSVKFNLQETKKSDIPVGLDAEIKREETAREIARRKLGLDKLENRNQTINVNTNQLETFNQNYMGGERKIFINKQSSNNDYSGTIGYNILSNSSVAKSYSDHDQKYQEYLKFMGLAPKEEVFNHTSSNSQNYQNDANNLSSSIISSNSNSTSIFTSTSQNNNDFGLGNQTSNFSASRYSSNTNSIGSTSQNSQTISNQNNSVSRFSTSTQKTDEHIFGSFPNSNTQESKKENSVQFSYNSPSEKMEFLDKFSNDTQNEEIKPAFVEGNVEKIAENNLKEIFNNNLDGEKIELSSAEKDNPFKNLNQNKQPVYANAKSSSENLVEENTEQQTRQKIKEYKYVKPTLDLLSAISTNPNEYGGNYQETGRKIESVLEEFKIPAKIIGITRGPAVTRYELEMPVGISVNRIPALESDIAMRIATSKKIMIQAPIPGMSAFGIEVPNDKVATVSLREILSNDAFTTHKSPCAFALGKEINGVIDVCAVNKMPHVLIAGSTGSGKSVCLNSLILSILFKSSPEDVKFILIDPKRVEFSIYQGLPHLIIPDIISEPRKADNALAWAIKEMEKRYLLLEQHRVRNIDEYNNMQDVKDRYLPKMPYIIIIMDEFADMMQSDCKDIENKVSKLAAKARAAGIHLVLATQRPSVDVLSGTAKNNFPARIAFFLTSQTDSRTILGHSGAENLLGKGDMLYVAPGSNEAPKRLQGCYVSDEEVKKVIEFVIQNNKVEYDETIEEEINKKKEADSVNPDGSFASYSNDDEEAEMEAYAKDVLKDFIRVGRASASYIQRMKRVGFNKAARILEYLAKKKYISEGDGTAKPRIVYITKQQYIELFGETDFDDHD